MAKVTGPLMSMGARGKLGNTLVFSGWKGIATIRSYVVPANPKTPEQVTQRDTMKKCVLFWNSSLADPAQRSGWNKAAALMASAMSGFNAYVASAINNINLPTWTGMLTISTLSGSSVGGTFTDLVTGAVPADQSGLEVWLGDNPNKLSLQTCVFKCTGGALSLDTGGSWLGQTGQSVQIRLNGAAFSGIFLVL